MNSSRLTSCPIRHTEVLERCCGVSSRAVPTSWPPACPVCAHSSELCSRTNRSALLSAAYIRDFLPGLSLEQVDLGRGRQAAAESSELPKLQWKLDWQTLTGRKLAPPLTSIRAARGFRSWRMCTIPSRYTVARPSACRSPRERRGCARRAKWNDNWYAWGRRQLEQWLTGFRLHRYGPTARAARRQAQYAILEPQHLNETTTIVSSFTLPPEFIA